MSQLNQKLSKNTLKKDLLSLKTIKELCLAVVIVLSAINTTDAQEFRIGAKAGLNFASLTGDIVGAKGRTSFHLGGMMEFPISDVFSLQPELLFSLQGAKTTGGNVNLTYLNIPAMAKYYVVENLSLEGGVLIGLLLSAKQEAGTQSVDISQTVSSLDLGFALGAGYKLESGLNFGLRYNLGLSNANDAPGSNASIKNGVLQVSAGYFFL